MRTFGRALAAAGLVAGLSLTAACGSEQPTDYAPRISEDERRLGAEQHPRLLAEFGGAYSASESAYVARLGARLAAEAGLDRQCTFTLVNSDVVNAFAVPGCYIYVTRGLMGIVNSEAELASVLGHELGHIVADHSERQQKRSVWRTLGVLAVGLVTGSDRLTQIAGSAAEYFTLRYSRNQEFESDTLGIRYLKQAGYDPHAAADMLGALARQEQYMARTGGRDAARGIPEWARTHPLTENRIARAREQAQATGASPNALPDGRAEYLREVDGLLFGDDPQQGFVLGRRFAHPVLRIGFEAPEGFTLTNSPQAILIEGPEGVRGEFGGGRMGPEGLDAHVAAMVQQLFGSAQAEIGTAERITVNGLSTIIVPISVATQQGALQVTIAAYAAAADSAFHFVMVSPPQAQAAPLLGTLLRSFHILAPDEAARLRAREIDVVEAGAGDTLQTLAARMASNHPIETLLMLNGRSADAAIRPGERVKLVAFRR